MLYKNNGKIYIKVSNKYKEVSVLKEGNNNYNVKAKANVEPIEIYGSKGFEEITLQNAYEILNKPSNKTDNIKFKSRKIL